MSNALKKINARVKVLQKKHPKSKRTTLQKQAGREWRAGKLKGAVGAVRKKHHVKKKTVAKKRRRTAKPKVVTRTRTIVKVVRAKRRRATHKKRTTARRRVSGVGKTSILLPIVGVAAVGLLAYYMMSRPTIPPFAPTNNPYRVQAQNSILQWATAAGLAASTITSIINSLNSSDDSTVIAAGSNPAATFAQSQLGD